MDTRQLHVLIALDRLVSAHNALTTTIAQLEARHTRPRPFGSTEAVILDALEPRQIQLSQCIERYFSSRGMHN